MMEAIESTTGARFPDAERAAIVGDLDELTLVNSGLEETMINAYHEIVETRRREPKIPDLRTAAFVNAIEKVARTYLELGVFP
jgi:glutamate dehydrogenase (NAD(P)+)